MTAIVSALIFLAAVASASAQPASQAVAAYNRGVENEHAAHHDQAIADLTRAIALRPDWAEAYESRGVAYDQKGLYDRAIADYTRAIALGDATAETYFNRGAAYEHRRLFQKALADYRTSLSLDPSLDVAKAGVRRLGTGR